MKISSKPRPVMSVDRTITKHKKLIYILLAPKPQKYPRGRSRVMYVGTTEKGVSRIASSVAARSEAIFAKWGIKNIDVQVASCSPLQRVRSWRLLERAILADFLSIYGELPQLNKLGKSYQWDSKVSRYFTRTAVTKLLDRFDQKKDKQ